MRKILALALLFGFLLFLSGCFTPNMSGPCCTKEDALLGRCNMYTAPGPDTPPNQSSTGTYEMCNAILSNGLECKTNWCAIANTSVNKNESVYYLYTMDQPPQLLNCTNISFSNTSDPCNNIGYCRITMRNVSKGCGTDAECAPNKCIDGKCGFYTSYPVCSDRQELSFDKECKTMLCGNIKYQPKSSLLPEPGKNPFYQNLGSSYSTNLYNAMCDFFLLDNVTMRKMSKGSGIFVNTYRFGLGESISDYEEGRLYFPLSDRWCGFIPEQYANYTKDRYMNYLNLSDLHGTNVTEFMFYGPFDPNTLKNRSIAVGCDEELDFPPAPDGNYLITTFTEGTNNFNHSYITTYIGPDVYKYKFSLQAAYWMNISGINNTNEADYECNQSLECISGICSKQEYGYMRSFCISNGTLKNCMCYEIGRRGHPGNHVLCEPYKDNSSFSPAFVTYDDGSKELADPIVFYANSSAHNGAVGYAFMDESDFINTMFYKSCNPNYATIENKCTCDENPDGTCDCKRATKIKIMSLGSCDPDDGEFKGIEVPSFPKLTNTYGWCEPCTLATMVGINLDEYWKKYVTIKSDGSVKAFKMNCPPESPGGCGETSRSGGIAVGIFNVTNDGCAQCGGRIREYITNLAYLRNRIDNYHKAGVMPVLWYVQGDLNYTKVKSGWYMVYQDCEGVDSNGLEPYVEPMKNAIREVLLGNFFYYYPDFGPFFEQADAYCTYWKSEENACGTKECIDPVTASPLSDRNTLGEFGVSTSDYAPGEKISLDICANPHPSYSMNCLWVGKYHFLRKANGNSASVVIIATDNMSVEEIGERAKLVRDPANCPNCLAALYVTNTNIENLDRIFGCTTGEQGCRISPNDVWKYIDVIAYDFKVNDVTGPDRKASILENSTAISRMFLKRYGKPSFQYNFVIDDNANDWQIYNDTFSTMKYLLSNETDLVNSGMFAMFYKKWYRDDSEGLTSSLNGTRPPTLKDEKFCALERAINLYLNPIRRKTVYNMVKVVNITDPQANCVPCTTTEKLLGKCDMVCENGNECKLPEGADEADYRCPTNVGIEPCSLCSETTGSLLCNFTSPEGEVNQSTFEIKTLNDDYGDIIASIPKEKRCCLYYSNNQTNESYYYTYSKNVNEGLLTIPVRYPRSGNEMLDCGLSKDSYEFCGVKLPIKNYKVECTVQ